MPDTDPAQEDAIAAAIQGYFESINSEDWRRLAGLFHEQAELRAPGTRPRVGGEGVASYYRDALSPYPEHHDEPTRVIPAGSTVTVEIHFEGRLANGRPMSFDAVDVFDFVDGRIHRLSSWYDSHRVRRDLLEAMTADAPGERDLDSFSEVTRSRLRWALGVVRRGVAFRLDAPGQRREGARGPARWDGLPAGLEALFARGVLLDLAGRAGGALSAQELRARASEQAVELRAGDVLMLRTGARTVASSELASWLREWRPAAVVGDAPVAGELGVARGTGWWLEELAEDCRRGGGWDGLLASVPCDDGAGGASARPVLLR